MEYEKEKYDEIAVNEKMQNPKKIIKNSSKNKKNTKKLSKSSNYFDFYDDIKSGCHKIVDW